MRTDQGLWLGEGKVPEAVQDELSTKVFRRIADDVPTRLETVFEITVAGTVREELIAPALPEGFVPLSLEGELPLRLSPDGDLQIQVRPGTWRVTLNARASGVADSVTLPRGESNLPDSEIWSYQGNSRLRGTLPEAPRPVDPSQVGSPWPMRRRAGSDAGSCCTSSCCSSSPSLPQGCSVGSPESWRLWR